ncbi:phosphatidate cytidylyltransferase [Hufsiella ginkgonis]|uniref:Phosphatidate cytidylyltransferase n=1 Tax=Hufsiella ginkgonis TaxID=2695274 RepID=A0A7K1XV83_9SPHI|nr:phosphatidate cytidylyltransferase [Hufsiella ginkgonis]MXV14679.1 phosphatidate cytidylyltransferase [Hufsiella ginkgonis]
MKTRAITGVFFVAVMLGSVLLGDYAFTFFFLLLSLLSLDEFYRLVRTGSVKPQRQLGIALGLLVYLPVAFHFFRGTPLDFLLVVVPAAVLVFIAELYRKHENPFHNIGYTLLGVIFAVLPFSFFHALAFLPGDYRFHLPLGFMLMLWASDTGAYLFGMKFGKTRLFERHSPKKSWEGFVGGMLTSFLVSVVISYFYSELSAVEWGVMSLIIATTGTLGDLAESMLKRSLGVKDSGSLLPGHGGLLDRFDGLLLSAPLVFVYLYFILAR